MSEANILPLLAALFVIVLAIMWLCVPFILMSINNKMGMIHDLMVREAGAEALRRNPMAGRKPIDNDPARNM